MQNEALENVTLLSLFEEVLLGQVQCVGKVEVLVKLWMLPYQLLPLSSGWCGVVWCGVVWWGVVWCGVVGCGVVGCGVVWCDVVWWGVVVIPHSSL